MNESEEGDWIKYDDIMHLLSSQSSLLIEYSRDIYRLQARIAEYEKPSKYAIYAEDIKNGYSIGAKEGLE